jgi:hypothetical protein
MFDITSVVKLQDERSQQYHTDIGVALIPGPTDLGRRNRTENFPVSIICSSLNSLILFFG